MLPGNPKGLPDKSFFSENTLVLIDEGFLSKFDLVDNSSLKENTTN